MHLCNLLEYGVGLMTFRFEPLPEKIEKHIQKQKEGRHLMRLFNNLLRNKNQEDKQQRAFDTIPRQTLSGKDSNNS